MSPKGVFCLEIGDWYESLTDGTSVKPVLKLLATAPSRRAPYIHRDIITEAELVYYLKKWPMQKHTKFPILYLAMHGESGEICLKKENGRDQRIGLDALAEILEGKCHKRIIHFGSCSTLLMHGHQVNSFLKQTGALLFRDSPRLSTGKTALLLILFILVQSKKTPLLEQAWKPSSKSSSKRSGLYTTSLGFDIKCSPEFLHFE